MPHREPTSRPARSQHRNGRVCWLPRVLHFRRSSGRGLFAQVHSQSALLHLHALVPPDAKKQGRNRNFTTNCLDRLGAAVIVPATFRPSARNDSTGERRPRLGVEPAAGLGNLPRAVVHAVKGDAGYVPAVHRGSLARGGGRPCRAGNRTSPEHHRHGSVHVRGRRRLPNPRQQRPGLSPTHRASRRRRLLHRLRIRHAHPDARRLATRPSPRAGSTIRTAA